MNYKLVLIITCSLFLFNCDQNFNNKPKLKIDVNHNPTKKGIKVQFIVPQGTDEAKKEEITQKLKTKLNKGLAAIGLAVDTDLDVPYQNVIGFLIRLESFKLFIKNKIDSFYILVLNIQNQLLGQYIFLF